MAKIKTLLKMCIRERKGQRETFEAYGYVHYFGCGHGFIVYTFTCQSPEHF